MPPGLFIDQAQYGLDAYRISRGETFPVFVEGPTKERGREPLFMYLMAGIFLVAGPTPVAIKLDLGADRDRHRDRHLLRREPLLR